MAIDSTSNLEEQLSIEVELLIHIGCRKKLGVNAYKERGLTTDLVKAIRISSISVD